MEFLLIKFVAFFTIVVLLQGCNPENNMDVMIKQVDAQVINSISNKKIYFGHQSVGANLIKGIELINRKTGNKLTINESKNIVNANINHFYLGENEKPYSKLKEFEDLIKVHSTDIDIAYMKFCYVDFNENTDVIELFSSYSNSIDKLEKTFPNIHFIKSTVPIRVINTSLKAKIKRLLGLDVWGDKQAIKRDEYNQLVRDKYGSGLLFDIANFESYANGVHNTVYVNGHSYQSLIKSISSDGSHLNSIGSEYIASEFLQLVSGVKQ